MSGCLAVRFHPTLGYAEQWVDGLDRKLTLWVTGPEMGRIVPEKGTGFFRKSVVGKYRVLYLYLHNKMTILAIRHSAGELDQIE
ncbi:type II toxin-antitoxin system RelE/ParE family toxin [Larkinella ripae]